ncbi:MAG: MraY family glycosyltransferase [bacterium]
MFFILFRHVVAFLFSFSFIIYLVPMVIKTAKKFGIVDVPDGKLKTHQRSTPYLGGLAIYLSFIATMMLTYPVVNNILWLFLGITLLMFIGLVDDFHVLSPKQKFLGQFIAVIGFLKSGYSLKTIFFNDWVNIFISAFWLLTVINAFNLIDVMDGLATTIAIMSSLTFFIIAIVLQEYFLSLLLIIFLGALLGFLYFNKSPAKIYLGDAGSLLIGGFLAAVPLLFPWSSVDWQAYYTPVVILAIPLLEVGFLVLIRTYKRLPFYNGSPHHFCIYLKNKGWNITKILLFTIFASIILSTIALLFLFNVISFLLLFILCFIFLLFWIFIIYI